MPADPEQTATIVISRAVRVGHEDTFGAWVDRIDRLATGAPGYRATIRLGQTAGFQHLLFRFDDRAAADAWRCSDPMAALSAEADRFSTALLQLDTGNVVTFELPSDASASKWKRFVTTWLAIFPILLIVSSLVRLPFKDAPLPLQLIPSSLLLTATLQWIVLPRLQRYTRFWVLQNSAGRLQT